MKALVRIMGALIMVLAVATCTPAGTVEPAVPGTKPDAAKSGLGDADLEEADARGLRPAPQPKDLGDISNLDVSPVPEPGVIVGHARWQSPGATLAKLASFANLPSGALNSYLRSGLEEAVRDGLDGLADHRLLAEVIAVDEPLDALFVLQPSRIGPPEPLFALAFGLTALQRAADAMQAEVIRVDAGLWQLKGGYGPSCVLAAAGGSTPARLVCGESFKHALTLAPYMARTLPTQPAQAMDLKVDIRFKNAARRFGSYAQDLLRGLPTTLTKLQKDHQAFDNALMNAANDVANDASLLVADLDSLTVELAVDRQKGIALTGKLSFAGQQSWTVQTLLDGASQAGPPPDIFWQLPKSVDVAYFGRSGDPARTTAVLKPASELLEAALAAEKIGTAADRKALTKLLSPIHEKHVGLASAWGHFASLSGAPSENALVQLYRETGGYLLLGAEQGPAKIKSQLEELVRTYSRPGIRKLLQEAVDDDDVLKQLPAVKKVQAPAALGQGAVAFELTVSGIEDPFGSPALPPPVVGPAPAPPPPPSAAQPSPLGSLTVHLLLMGEGKRTWLGLSTERDELVQVMAGLKGAKPGADSLASRPDLGVFKSGAHLGGGFSGLSAIVVTLPPALRVLGAIFGVSNHHIQQAIAVLGQLPNQGRTPVITLIDANAGRAPSLSFSYEVPRGTFTDIGFVVNEVLRLIGGP